MKKNFKLTDEKLAQARKVDAIKHEINKYIARERRKPVTTGIDFWDFNCKIGADQATATDVHVSEINKSIDAMVAKELEGFYLEIVAKPGHRTKKPN